MMTTIRNAYDERKKPQVTYRRDEFGYVDAPDDAPFPHPNQEAGQIAGVAVGGVQWVMGGASRRGNAHRYHGTHRDDALVFMTAGGWHIIAVSDGAGGSPFSRATARLSVGWACDVIGAKAQDDRPNDTDYTTNLMKAALTEAVHRVRGEQVAFNHKHGYQPEDTYCTLMILVHKPLPNGGCVLASFQVGDGYMLGVSDVSYIKLATGDDGVEAATTQFVLSLPLQKLEKRIEAKAHDEHFHTFMLVTDGIQDDLKVSHEEHQAGSRLEHKALQFATNLGVLLRHFPLEYWGDILFKEIDYEITGSQDDRTIVMLTTLPDQPTPFMPDMR